MRGTNTITATNCVPALAVSRERKREVDSVGQAHDYQEHSYDSMPLHCDRMYAV